MLDAVEGRGVSAGRRISCLVPLVLAGVLVFAGVARILFIFWKDEQRHLVELSLKSMGMALDLYAEDDPEHYFPRISAAPGHLIFRNEQARDGSRLLPDRIWPGYLVPPTNHHFVRGEKYKDAASIDMAIAAGSYYYLGYMVTNDDEVRAFAAAYKEYVSSGTELSEADTRARGVDLLNGRFSRLRRKLGESNSNERLIPVLIEHPEYRDPPGGNVLYLDNHVEFIPYPGKWPMTETTISTLRTLTSATPGEAPTAR